MGERTFLVRCRRHKFATEEQAELLSRSEIRLRRGDVTLRSKLIIRFSWCTRRCADNFLPSLANPRRGFLGNWNCPATWTIPKKRCRANVSSRQTNSLAPLMIDRSIVVDATRATIKLTISSKSNRPLSFTLALKRVLRYISGRATLTSGRIPHREQVTGNV